MDAFTPSHLEVINESHGRVEDESHFKAVVVSAAFSVSEKHCRSVSAADSAVCATVDP
jgi:stress-induced morphogen